MTKQINISSTTIDKGIDLARDFLDKLIGPALSETGLLLKDKVTMWKFKNQVNMLNKAKEICEKRKITTKAISLKLLCPLLDNAALEEDEMLQNKWSTLLANMVDSEQNIENHVFPYILGQISSNEFFILDKVFQDKGKRVDKLNRELEDFRSNRSKIETSLQNHIDNLEFEIKQRKLQVDKPYDDKVWELESKQSKIGWKLSSLKYKEAGFIRLIKESERVPEKNLRDFELSNLIRLGLVRSQQDTSANTQSLEIPNSQHEQYLKVDFDIDIEVDNSYVLTELGELFIDACTDKQNKTAPNI